MPTGNENRSGRKCSRLRPMPGVSASILAFARNAQRRGGPPQNCPGRCGLKRKSDVAITIPAVASADRLETAQAAQLLPDRAASTPPWPAGDSSPRRRAPCASWRRRARPQPRVAPSSRTSDPCQRYRHPCTRNEDRRGSAVRKSGPLLAARGLLAAPPLPVLHGTARERRVVLLR